MCWRFVCICKLHMCVHGLHEYVCVHVCAHSLYADMCACIKVFDVCKYIPYVCSYVCMHAREKEGCILYFTG